MVKEWITREGQSVSIRAAKQLLAPVAIKGKMLNDDLTKELEKSHHSKKQRPEHFDSSDHVTAAKNQERNVNTAWYNKTEYQCQDCSRIFSDVHGLIRHINAIHGMSVEEYKCRGCANRAQLFRLVLS